MYIIALNRGKIYYYNKKFNQRYQRVIKSVDVWCGVATFTLTTWPRSLYPFPCETRRLRLCVWGGGGSQRRASRRGLREGARGREIIPARWVTSVYFLNSYFMRCYILLNSMQKFSLLLTSVSTSVASKSTVFLRTMMIISKVFIKSKQVLCSYIACRYAKVTEEF